MDLNEYFDETVNSAIHGSTNSDSLDDLYTNYPDSWARNIEQFADSLYLLDNTVDIDAVIAAIENLSTTQANAHSGYASIDLLVERYALRVAQRYYAQSILDTEIVDETNDNYISDEDVLNYYIANKKENEDINYLYLTNLYNTIYLYYKSIKYK